MVLDLGKRGTHTVFTIDDRSGRIEASIFEDAFAQYRTLIVKGAILIVEGSLRFDEFIEGWRLSVKRSIDIDQAREQHARRLLLKFPAAIDARFLQTFEHTLQPHRGGLCHHRALLQPGRPGGIGVVARVVCEAEPQAHRSSDVDRSGAGPGNRGNVVVAGEACGTFVVGKR